MNEKVSVAPTAVLSTRLAELADLLRTDPGAVRDRAFDILKAIPGEPHALRLLVGAYRRLGDLAGARDSLRTLARSTPDLADIHRELSTILGELGDRQGAGAALSRATALEPDYPAAHFGNVPAIEDDPAASAEHIALQLSELRELELVLANQEWAAGKNILREFLSRRPTNLFAIWKLADVNLRLDRRQEAETLLERALALAPDFSRARHMYAWCLFRRAKYERSQGQLEYLLQTDPNNPDYLRLKATAQLMQGDYDGAIVCLEQLVKKAPLLASAWADFGHALRTVGRREEAIAALRRAISLQPGLGGAWWNLASLRTFRFASSDIEIMRQEVKREDLDDDSRVRMHHALGKALEDEQQYAESFAHYARGNALHRKSHPYDARAVTDALSRVKAIFTRELFERRNRCGRPASDPIFVVGMTRAGSTLIEQILASHPLIEGTKELRIMNSVLTRLNDPKSRQALRYPEVVPALDPDRLQRLGEEYMTLAGPHRKLDRPHFVDKSPGNFQQVGLIHLILPNAKIIDARRHPLACGFANFRHYFPHGQSFASDLADIGHFYRTYVDQMAHFDGVLPGRVHRVFYEDLVANTEGEVRALLAHCGLPFDERCLKFHETQRSVLTPSSEQVRQPIFTEALAQWRRYEEWLDPLKAALGEVLTAYPAVPVFKRDGPTYRTISFHTGR
ncbi:MAG: sulfotransferase [Alphaproteobacteria bacterium]|nr:sulfotransferase [Alphaproteobacteria bacterium]